VILRETWDYHLRLDEFLAWVERVSTVTRLLNPPSIVRWNAHKGYLRDLEQRGIPIIPTIWLAAGTRANFAALMQGADWQKAVIKPTVSASAFETRLFTPADGEQAQAHLDRLLPTRDLMMQEFLSSVLGYGERSLMFIEGQFTHSVRRSEPFRDDDLPNPTLHADATEEEIAFARSVLATLPETPLYARVDIALDNSDRLCLMELELIEPSLFFELSPEAAGVMAGAIERGLLADPKVGTYLLNKQK
ncbi:MAG: hypothetical protein ABIQ44_03420, partial [Chloroflexia bacterium]